MSTASNHCPVTGTQHEVGLAAGMVGARRTRDMNRSALIRMLARKATATMGHALVLVLSGWALTTYAAGTTAPLRVTVHLDTGVAPPSPELCTVIGAFAASVTVSCPADQVRFVTHPPLADQPASSETNVEAGIVTSWRKIQVGGKDYLEMTVRW